MSPAAAMFANDAQYYGRDLDDAIRAMSYGRASFNDADTMVTWTWDGVTTYRDETNSKDEQHFTDEFNNDGSVHSWSNAPL
jgi:hypothetical protein